MHIRWLLVPVLVCLTLACSGDKKLASRTGEPAPVATGVSASPATPTALGTAATPQAFGLQVVPIKWIRASVFDMNSVKELNDPFASDRERRNLPAGTPSLWSVQVVEGDAAPREIYSSGRWLKELTWDQSGLSVDFMTRRSIPVTPFGGSFSPMWQGKAQLDPTLGKVNDVFEVLPQNDGPNPGEQGRSVVVQRDFSGRQALVTVSNGAGPFALIESAFLVDDQGNTRRLEGLTDLRSVNWLPSGKTLYAYMSNGASITNPVIVPTNDLYLIPTSNGEAIHLGTAPFGVEGSFAPLQSGTSRLITLLPDATSTTAGASTMVLYDTGTHQMRVLGSGPAVLGSKAFCAPPSIVQSGQPYNCLIPNQVPITWPEGSTSFAIGSGSDAFIVDARTGATRRGEPQELFKPYVPQNTTSPGGRYEATFESPDVLPVPQTDCRGKVFRLNVKDTQTGVTKALMECPSGQTGFPTWVSDGQLVASIYNCSACEPSSTALFLVDVVMGTAKPLTDGLEAGVNFISRTDGMRLLVAGKSLRVFDNDGQLLRDLGPVPEGYEVKSLVWSPDGESFAFILGPPGWFLGGI